MKSIREIDLEFVTCRGLGHRWLPLEGEYVVIAGQKAIYWVLECKNGCKSTATECRFKNGERVPGSFGRRKYKPSDGYKESRGFYRYEYVGELYRRGYPARKIRHLRAG